MKESKRYELKNMSTAIFQSEEHKEKKINRDLEASWEYQYMFSRSPRRGEKGAEGIFVETMAPDFSKYNEKLYIHPRWSTNGE